MKQLNFDSGLITYNINNTCEVTINPHDINFVEKLYLIFEQLEEKQKKYHEEVQNTDDLKKVFEIARARDAEMRASIDELFGAPICDSVFGSMNTFAITEDGIPAWASLLLTIIDECDVDVQRMNEKARAKIDKYTKKYHK